ncbi:hypothetical protein HG536_0A01860 [Torulaspora globosa]|uniref:Uncharacterized protein n=1 Tax=Torulaspora globosa TaxID=48254 RepID=A0A7G3ZA33_9SACH|nr:uncharacterized protein HG536_0A01860 [Torulaspora globosa]QLL30369.1 hypothetical protein HG536_0A01860 [Torulaspora globosa]
MEASEMLEGLCERVERLEVVLGEVGPLSDDDLCEKVASVTRELQRVFREGQEYSEHLLQLLEIYALGDHERGEDHEVKLQAILSRYDEIFRSLKELRKLDVAYQELSKQEMDSRIPVVEIGKVQQLPALMEACNRQLVRSLSLVQRFASWNVQTNELFCELNNRLKMLERDIDSMSDYV